MATRENRFRAKSLLNGEWVYGDIQRDVFHKKNIKPIGGCCTPIEEETVGQCSGVPAECGTLIYEDDIVEPVQTSGNYEGFSWGRQVCVFDRGSFGLKDHRGVITPLCNYSASVKFKLCGNVHDNPELLEG